MAHIYIITMQVASSLEVFSQMTDTDVNEIYTNFKKETKKVTRREHLEQRLKQIVKLASLLKWHLGIETQDVEKDLSEFKVVDLRDIHRTMRQCMIGGRTRKQKLQKIARMMQIVDYFLQF